MKTSVVSALGALAVCGACVLAPASRAIAQEDVADIPLDDRTIGGDKHKRYLLIGPVPKAEAPAEGFGLVVVMPGGDGSDEFQYFVKRILKYALPDGYVVAQPVAFNWAPGQRIVWPTRKSKVMGQKFSTEDFVAAVIEDVKKQHKIDAKRVFTLSWSSSGPAAYAISLDENSPVRGSYIAMSVFKPASLPDLKLAKGHAYFIDHSPDDKVCPFKMAEEARDKLKAAGAAVEFSTYEGGHGWHGDMWGRIRRGITWLEAAKPAEDDATPEVGAVRGSAEAPSRGSAKVAGGSAKVAAGAMLFATETFELDGGTIQSWQPGPAVDGVEFLWDRATGYRSRASYCLKKTAQRYFPIAQYSRTIDHTGGAGKLSVEAQVKADKATKAVIDVQFLDAAGATLSHEWAAYIGAKNAGDPPADHDWKAYSGTVTIPAGAKQIVIALQIYGPGTVWFDDVTATYEGG